jgi:hypothetical protein
MKEKLTVGHYDVHETPEKPKLFPNIKDLGEIIEERVKEEKKKLKEKIKEAFEAGFKYGQQEQVQRDFPDVGPGWDHEADYYYEIWMKRNEEENK